MASLYIVKKPQLLKQIVKWLLLFLEYGFLMVYKPRSSHFMANTFLQLLDATKNLGVLDQTIDASLFVLQPQWLQEVHTYFSIDNFPEGYSTKQ
jgi:hypothetical protein